MDILKHKLNRVALTLLLAHHGSLGWLQAPCGDTGLLWPLYLNWEVLAHSCPCSCFFPLSAYCLALNLTLSLSFLFVFPTSSWVPVERLLCLVGVFWSCSWVCRNRGKQGSLGARVTDLQASPSCVLPQDSVFCWGWEAGGLETPVGGALGALIPAHKPSLLFLFYFSRTVYI